MVSNNEEEDTIISLPDDVLYEVGNYLQENDVSEMEKNYRAWLRHYYPYSNPNVRPRPYLHGYLRWVKKQAIMMKVCGNEKYLEFYSHPAHKYVRYSLALLCFMGGASLTGYVTTMVDAGSKCTSCLGMSTLTGSYTFAGYSRSDDIGKYYEHNIPPSTPEFTNNQRNHPILVCKAFQKQN